MEAQNGDLLGKNSENKLSSLSSVVFTLSCCATGYGVHFTGFLVFSLDVSFVYWISGLNPCQALTYITILSLTVSKKDSLLLL